MMTYKISKVESKILALAVVLFLISVLVTQMTVLAATNDATQEASSNKAETIAIKSQDGTTADITTITFPAAAPSTEVTTPYNNSDGIGSPQVLAATSLPVATLISATDYNLWVSVTEVSGWDTLVVDENIFCSNLLTIDQTAFDAGKTALSSWGTVTDMGTQTVTTANKHLYLTINLDAGAAISGSSTIAVLGETI